MFASDAAAGESGLNDGPRSSGTDKTGHSDTAARDGKTLVGPGATGAAGTISSSGCHWELAVNI